MRENFTATVLNATSVTLAWNPLPLVERRVRIANYTIKYSYDQISGLMMGGGNGSVAITVSDQEAPLNVTINNLKPAGQYLFQISACSAEPNAVCGNYSVAINAITKTAGTKWVGISALLMANVSSLHGLIFGKGSVHM